MPHLPTNGRGQVTEKLIKELPLTASGQTLYWHPELLGFGVLVGKRSRSYIAQAKIRLNGRKRDRRVTIGNADVWTLPKAEARARELIIAIQSGEDPKSTSRAEAENWTLRKMLDHVRQKKAQPDYADVIEKFLSDWMDINPREITGLMVQTRYGEIQDQVRASRGTDGIATANQVMKYLRAIWNEVDKLDEALGRNPTAALKGDWKQNAPRADRIPEDKLCNFWEAIWDEPFISGRDVVIFMLLTGLRREVACSLRVDEYDTDTGLLRLDGKRMKSGNDYEAPVADEVRLLLDRRLKHSSGQYLFEGKSSGRGKRRLSADNYVKEPRYVLDRVGKASGFHSSVHGLRRTYASEAMHVIGELQRKILMAHALGNDVTARHYTSVSADSLRGDAQAVADRIIGYAEFPDEVRRRIKTGEGTGPTLTEKRQDVFDKSKGDYLAEVNRAAADGQGPTFNELKAAKRVKFGKIVD